MTEQRGSSTHPNSDLTPEQKLTDSALAGELERIANQAAECISAQARELADVKEQYSNYHAWAQEEIERIQRANAELLRRNAVLSTGCRT